MLGDESGSGAPADRASRRRCCNPGGVATTPCVPGAVAAARTPGDDSLASYGTGQYFRIKARIGGLPRQMDATLRPSDGFPRKATIGSGPLPMTDAITFT